MKKGNVITENDTIKDRLEKLRKNKGYISDDNGNDIKLTQTVLADYLGITPRQYTNYLNGISNMDSYVLCKLADLYGVSIDCLLCRTRYTSVDNEMISQETGLTDTSIENIKALNEHVNGMNLSLQLFNHLSNGTLKREPRLIMDTFNKLLSSERFEDLIFSFDDFLRTHYNKPVHFEPGTGWQLNNRKINNGVPCITLAYDETNLTENMDIPINDTFLETIALKEIEKILYSMKRD